MSLRRRVRVKEEGKRHRKPRQKRSTAVRKEQVEQKWQKTKTPRKPHKIKPIVILYREILMILIYNVYIEKCMGV